MRYFIQGIAVPHLLRSHDLFIEVSHSIFIGPSRFVVPLPQIWNRCGNHCPKDSTPVPERRNRRAETTTQRPGMLSKFLDGVGVRIGIPPNPSRNPFRLICRHLRVDHSFGNRFPARGNLLNNDTDVVRQRHDILRSHHSTFHPRYHFTEIVRSLKLSLVII